MRRQYPCNDPFPRLFGTSVSAARTRLSSCFTIIHSFLIGLHPPVMRNFAMASGGSPRVLVRIFSALINLTRMVAPESLMFARCSQGNSLQGNQDEPAQGEHASEAAHTSAAAATDGRSARGSPTQHTCTRQHSPSGSSRRSSQRAAFLPHTRILRDPLFERRAGGSTQLARFTRLSLSSLCVLLFRPFLNIGKLLLRYFNITLFLLQFVCNVRF